MTLSSESSSRVGTGSSSCHIGLSLRAVLGDVTGLVTSVATLGLDVDGTVGLAVPSEVVRTAALPTRQLSPSPSTTSLHSGTVSLHMTTATATKAFLLLIHRRTVSLDVTLASTAVALRSVDAGAVGLDVAFTTAVVALLGLGGSWSRAGGGFVSRFETVEASTVCVAAVLG